MRVFRYERLLHWSECDAHAIIFFPHYARWMVEGVNLLFLGLGIDPNGPCGETARQGLPSIGYSMTFHRPARLHDRLVHEIAVTRIGTKSVAFHHRILRGDDCLAEADETRVWAETDATGMRGVPVPAGVRALLESDDPVPHPLACAS